MSGMIPDTTSHHAAEDAGLDALMLRAQRGLSVAPSPLIFDGALGRAISEAEAARRPELRDDFMIGKPLRRAAVLVAIVAREQPTLLLTQRTEHLPSHAGQIAFPGGKLEPGDTDAVAAALREAHEEIGLDGGFVEPIGFLDALRTHTGFHVDPVVAIVRPGFELTLDASEVADAFEVPLAFLMNAANHRIGSRLRDGRERRFYEMPYGDRYIWGATASMIKNMQLRLYPG